MKQSSCFFKAITFANVVRDNICYTGPVRATPTCLLSTWCLRNSFAACDCFVCHVCCINSALDSIGTTVSWAET